MEKHIVQLIEIRKELVISENFTTAKARFLNYVQTDTVLYNLFLDGSEYAYILEDLITSDDIRKEIDSLINRMKSN